MWQVRLYQSLPKIVFDYPDTCWMFLTLTVRRCTIVDLGETLTAMNAAFQRMKARREFKLIQGWIRTTEVTCGRNGLAHPHFHTLMMVPPGILHDYVKYYRWMALWRDCLRVDYNPNIDVRTVKFQKPEDGKSQGCATAEQVRSAVVETLKYSIKPSDMAADPDWLLELTRQTHNRRFVATGGALRDALKLSGTRRRHGVGDDISEDLEGLSQGRSTQP
uniref:protein rep n=1 Tax=Yersinia frederiksenii TaxID=29484 RepID=UPI003B66BDD9|nr:Replication protein [Yersinia frederiksenii]